MKSLREVANQTLTWAKPGAFKAGLSFKHQFELRTESEVVATLRWQKLVGSLAVAETADGLWTFKRAGFLRPYVTIRAANAQTDLAVFKPNLLGGGWLEFPNGSRRHWMSTGFWGTTWAFANEAGEPLVQFTPKFTVINPAAEVKFNPAAIEYPEMFLLITLGWYLMILTAEDSGAGSVAVMGAV